MKVITKRDEYEKIRKVAEQVVCIGVEFPEYIFRVSYPHLLFIDADILSCQILWGIQKDFLPAIGQDYYWAMAINPDPIDFYEKRFGDFYGTFEFSAKDSEETFLDGMARSPKSDSNYSLSTLSEALLVFSPTSEWAFYGERDSVGVCGFSTKEQRDAFKTAYGEQIMESVKEAADFAYGETSWRKGRPELEKQFIRNYGPQLMEK